MKARELRELTDEELRQRLSERRDAIRAFRFQAATGTVENVRGARNAKRDVARIHTIIREREMAETKGAKK